MKISEVRGQNKTFSARFPEDEIDNRLVNTCGDTQSYQLILQGIPLLFKEGMSLV